MAGARFLSDELIAEMIRENLYHHHGTKYYLIAYCIMSNHGHLLVDTGEHDVQPTHKGVTVPYPLADTLKLLRGRTARSCNQALKRSGAFWHHESYDHVVRDQKEYERIAGYIASNPVKAGLVENWEDWKFTFVSQNL